MSRILSAAEQLDPHAADGLLQSVYNELRQLAARMLAQEKHGQSLDATALVHEAYLRLVPEAATTEELAHWNGRAHFFGAAAQAMRRILVERARHKACLKYGKHWRRIARIDFADAVEDSCILALDDALVRLAEEDSQAARVVELHHFAGFSHEVVAETLGITVYQVRLKWRYARAWLRDALEG